MPTRYILDTHARPCHNEAMRNRRTHRKDTDAQPIDSDWMSMQGLAHTDRTCSVCGSAALAEVNRDGVTLDLCASHMITGLTMIVNRAKNN